MMNVESRLGTRVLVLAVFLSVLSVGGCAAKRADLVADGVFALERTPEKRGYWRDIYVLKNEGELSVTGFVRRLLEPGELQVSLVSADGEVIAEKRVPVHRPYRSSRVRHARFEARFSVTPPAGSVVRLRHARG